MVLPVSEEDCWAQAQALGVQRFRSSLQQFRDPAQAIQVAVGTARQHMLRAGHQPGAFAEQMHSFDAALRAGNA